MGKRELLIIAGFIVVGMVAYQLTAATPRTNNRPRFSFSDLLSHVRREARGNRATATITTTGTIADVDALTEARVSNVSNITVTGETRQDVSYELRVEATGADETSAANAARLATVVQDRLGSVLRLRVTAPRNMRQVATLVLHVPARWAVGVDSTPAGTRIVAQNVAGVEFDAVVGDARFTNIAGKIQGTHRNGELVIASAGSLNLTLASSQARLDEVRGPIVLTSRNGRLEIREAAGRLDLDVNNVDSTIVSPHGAVRVRGTGGRLRVSDPQSETTLDMRRTAIDVTVTRAVPLTAVTMDAPLRLVVHDVSRVALDAVATDGGTIDATALGLTPETSDQESRLRHGASSGANTLALRNQRAPIVIGVTK